MANLIRRQLTLFVEQEDATTIEKVRQMFNPKQSELIKSHVTLCREDEIENLEAVIFNLSNLETTAIEIEFGKVTRFDNGKGVLLPAIPDNVKFQALRKQILTGLFDNPRLQEPHITLMHPRNSTCTDEIYKEICNFDFPNSLTFKKIDLIEQVNGGQWTTLQTFPLAGRG
ncbi:MAG: 2'-5' RNA ligase family protein [Saprospiraceae bacterium]|nr:2'-5' RNA ligase family protein [Saprospiraceae bacterium]